MEGGEGGPSFVLDLACLLGRREGTPLVSFSCKAELNRRGAKRSYGRSRSSAESGRAAVSNSQIQKPKRSSLDAARRRVIAFGRELLFRVQAPFSRERLFAVSTW